MIYPGGPNPATGPRIFLAEEAASSVPWKKPWTFSKRPQPPACYFLEQKPQPGGIPILELDDGTCISESVAIGAISRNCIPEPPSVRPPARNSAHHRDVLRRVELT